MRGLETEKNTLDQAVKDLTQSLVEARIEIEHLSRENAKLEARVSRQNAQHLQHELQLRALATAMSAERHEPS